MAIPLKQPFMNCKPSIICSTNNDHLQVRTHNCWCYLFTVSYKYKCPTNRKCIFTILCFSAFYTDHLFQGRLMHYRESAINQCSLDYWIHFITIWISSKVSDKKKNGRPDLTWPTFQLWRPCFHMGCRDAHGVMQKLTVFKTGQINRFWLSYLENLQKIDAEDG